MSINMDPDEANYEVDMILGDEEQVKELTKKIRNIAWNTFSTEFDIEMDKTLKSE